MFYNNSIYREDLKSILDCDIPLEDIKGCSVLVTGASGLIGSFLVDVLMLCNELLDYDISVYAMGRNRDTLEKRFRTHCNSRFNIIQHDVNHPLSCNQSFDYIIHAASNAYPEVFSSDPVGTIMGNIWGVYNLLDYARQNSTKRFLFISSGEAYGQGTEEISAFDETYSGYVDSTSPRSSYPNAKRTGETLCTSFAKQYGIDTVIVRPCHTYGPTTTAKDNRVSAQFVNNILMGENIVMKSQGLQLRSYCYVADCVSGILITLLKGEISNAYNIANKNSNVTIRELSETIAEISGKRVIFELPSDSEQKGYNPVIQSVLNPSKLERLGWEAKYDIHNGLARTIKILEQIKSI